MGILEIKEKIKQKIGSISNLRTYLFLGIPLVGVLLLLILFQFTPHDNKTITTKVTPPTIKPKPSIATQYGSIEVTSPVSGAEFLLRNTVYYAPTTIQKINIGTYTLTAHNEGYQDESYKIAIQNNKLTKVSLKMDKTSTESAIDQVEKTWVSGMQQESQQVNQNIQTTNTKYPLTQYLPHPIGSVMLDYNVNSDGSVQYVVYALPGQTYNKTDYVDQVNTYIKSVGIDPSTIAIQWE